MKTNDSQKAKRSGGYHKRPNDLITAKEAVLLIDHRVSVLIAHWENERRKRVWWRRCVAWVLGSVQRADKGEAAQ